MINAQVEGKELVIRIPLQAPTPSGSGKNLVVATSHGFQESTAEAYGKPVKLNLNATIER